VRELLGRGKFSTDLIYISDEEKEEKLLQER
jgi:hypothetical protein